MSYQVYPEPVAASAPVPSQFPASAAGTYTITSIESGLYEITTDTSQSSFTLGFKTSEGFLFEGTVRGGKGYIEIPRAANQIVIPAGLTYPLIINYVKSSNFALTSAPTSVSWAWQAAGSVSPFNFTGSLSATYPSGATGYRIYWTNGTITTVANTTSPSAQTTVYPVVNGSGVSRNFIVAAKDANGIYSTATAVTSTGNSNSQEIAASFTSSGTWVAPTGVSSVRYLVVAGGGGGGGASYNAAGGGAGGVRAGTSLAVTAGTSYTVTVGAGGSSNYNGNTSTFNGISSSGGGRGGTYQGSANGAAGGSGGGGGPVNGTGGAGNSGGYSPVEGYAGGAAFNNSSPQQACGGGGGAGAVGGTGTSTNAGNGGVGVTNDITGTSTYYGGGGGGGKKAVTAGTGGLGGGGNGGTYDGSVQGQAGTANTGGGAGGRSPAGPGGSGIVIIRYTA
jgi:hypothetical protein